MSHLKLQLLNSDYQENTMPGDAHELHTDAEKGEQSNVEREFTSCLTAPSGCLSRGSKQLPAPDLYWTHVNSENMCDK